MKIFKTKKSSVFCFFIAFLFIAASAYSQSIYISSVTGATGNMVKVPIYLENTPNMVESFGAKIYFDGTSLEYKGIDKTGSIAEKFTLLNSNLIGSGIIKIAGVDVSGGFNDGTSGLLVTLIFKVIQKDCSKGVSSSIELAGLTDGMSGWATGNGSFTCEGVPCDAGNCNDDDPCTIDSCDADQCVNTPITYTITTALSGLGGQISPVEATVNCGTTQVFSIFPYKNYTIANVSVDGIPAGQIGQYVFDNITSNHIISASFTQITPPSSNAGKKTAAQTSTSSSPNNKSESEENEVNVPNKTNIANTSVKKNNPQRGASFIQSKSNNSEKGSEKFSGSTKGFPSAVKTKEPNKISDLPDKSAASASQKLVAKAVKNISSLDSEKEKNSEEKKTDKNEIDMSNQSPKTDITNFKNMQKGEISTAVKNKKNKDGHLTSKMGIGVVLLLVVAVFVFWKRSKK